jgi:hypothetical protein
MLIECSSYMSVQPGPGWHDVLLEANRVNWILELYAHIRQRQVGGPSWMDSPLAVSARQLIVQLFSLNGNIFSSGESDTSSAGLVFCLLVAHRKLQEELWKSY